MRHTFRRSWATLVLIAWTCGFIVPFTAGAHAEPDIECGETAWATPHHGRPQFERVLPPLHGDHCAVCHLQRTLRDMSGACGVVVAQATAFGTRVTHDLQTVPSSTRRDVPSRAPPSFLN